MQWRFIHRRTPRRWPKEDQLMEHCDCWVPCAPRRCSQCIVIQQTLYRFSIFSFTVFFCLRRCSFSFIFQPPRSLAHHCSLRDLWRTWTLTTCTMEKKAHWMAFLSWLFFHISPTLWELFNVEAIELDTVVCNSCLGACANAARWQEALDLVPFSSGRSGREPQQHNSCRIAPTKLRLMTAHKLNKTTATCFSVCS